MRVFILILFFGCALLTTTHAQVSVSEESGVARMMSDFIRQNQQKKTIDGWRIQIITTNDRRKSESAKAKFESMYPEMRAFWIQEVPFYKVKVGAFETKEELQGLLLDLKADFPSVIPVVDQISIDELAL